MNFEFKVENLENGFSKISVLESDYTISFDEALGMLENSNEFREQLITFLKSIEYPFNIECPAITVDDVNKMFEFVVIKTPALNNISPSFLEFTEQFTNNEPVAIFENLGGDAILLSPSPLADDANFAHFAAFLANAENSQIHELFTALGEIASVNLGKNPLYINTSGLGVHWLHIRIDDTPKYYQFDAYKS